MWVYRLLVSMFEFVWKHNRTNSLMSKHADIQMGWGKLFWRGHSLIRHLLIFNKRHCPHENLYLMTVVE